MELVYKIEREHGHRGEPGVLQQLAEGEAKVLKEVPHSVQTRRRLGGSRRQNQTGPHLPVKIRAVRAASLVATRVGQRNRIHAGLDAKTFAKLAIAGPES